MSEGEDVTSELPGTSGWLIDGSWSLGGQRLETVVFSCTLGTFRIYFKFEEKSKEERDEGLPCSRGLGVATDRQGAGDTTGQ